MVALWMRLKVWAGLSHTMFLVVRSATGISYTVFLAYGQLKPAMLAQPIHEADGQPNPMAHASDLQWHQMAAGIS